MTRERAGRAAEGLLRLGVNIDHVATVRQARLGRLPDPMAAARACLEAGADSIVCHLREDRRHIQDGDVRVLRGAVPFLNLEMSVAPSVVDVALEVRPWQATLVPERRRELTTEGGLDAKGAGRRLAGVVRRLAGAGIAVSLFIDPAESQVRAARDLGVPVIELHTGRYADTPPPERDAALGRLARAASLARRIGLRVAAGHGLDYENVGPVAALDEVEELNIGFSIIARALFEGLPRAVADMAARMASARGAEHAAHSAP
ncbi:MAG TPA: pyridoxine 5'-phosphate synthase [bacterium]